jgi:putative membrane protein
MFPTRPCLFSALLLGAAAAVPANAVQAVPLRTAESAMTDGQSLGIAEAASTGESELSSAATSRVRSKAVQQLAQTTLDDHNAAIQKARALGDELHLLAAPTEASNELRKEANDATSHLENATPANLDRNYVEGAIRFHQKVLKAIDATVLRTSSPEVKQLFENVRTQVGRELDRARGILATLPQQA